MKVYVLTSGEYSDYRIEAVKVEKAEAKKLEKIHPDWQIETYDTEEIQVKEKYLYYVVDDVWISFSDSIAHNMKLREPKLIEYSWMRPKWHWAVYVEAEDAEHAQKIAYDLIAQARYENEVDMPEEPEEEINYPTTSSTILGIVGTMGENYDKSRSD